MADVHLARGRAAGRTSMASAGMNRVSLRGAFVSFVVEKEAARVPPLSR
ncbi:MAG: hypothetical protein H7Z15_12325 [Rhizobacter sp.]|nr:hypothetical protein [Rhizobacter sp.]